MRVEPVEVGLERVDEPRERLVEVVAVAEEEPVQRRQLDANARRIDVAAHDRHDALVRREREIQLGVALDRRSSC